jgi:hypothetical protein
MPVTYQINREACFIETYCTGTVTFDEVMDHFEQLEAEAALPERLDVLLDLEGATTLPESGQLLEVARAVDPAEGQVGVGCLRDRSKPQCAFWHESHVRSICGRIIRPHRCLPQARGRQRVAGLLSGANRLTARR